MPDAPNRPSVNQGQVIAPQPTPQSYVLNNVRLPDGNQLVALSFYSATGHYVAFIDPDSAERLGNELAAHASSARAGLIVAANLPETPKGAA
ncbi:MAG TPA: hypothetical protein VFH54_12675 [Mycobacteriales bacterium]|nr:hypothetical protein [Mycobacteriales bacterium]